MDSFLKGLVVSIHDAMARGYGVAPPFDPPEAFPELGHVGHMDPSNRIYAMVRDVFLNLGMDAGAAGTSAWNPLGDLIRPGQTVVIKPNLVTHRHYLGHDALMSTVVNGSVLRPIIDYARLALGPGGGGRIIVADNPVEGADFDMLMDVTGIGEMARELGRRGGYEALEVLDLRPRALVERQDGAFVYETRGGDPLGYVEVELGRGSMFGELDVRDGLHYYTLADPTIDHLEPRHVARSQTDEFHSPASHRYIVSRTVLSADCLISVGKMKTHAKAGVTLALKNMIGIVYDKRCMPHHRPGGPPDGDSFPSEPARHYVWLRKAYSAMRRGMAIHRLPCFRQVRDAMQRHRLVVGQHIEHGNWRGNDTIWRTILDLNRVAMYADRAGVMREDRQRRYLGLIDAVVSQEGDGPMCGSPVVTSMVLGGYNPVCLDTLGVRVMGIEEAAIPSIGGASGVRVWPLLGEDTRLEAREIGGAPGRRFELPVGWR